LRIRPGDQSFANGERLVPTLDKRVGSALARRHLDVRQADSGMRLESRYLIAGQLPHSDWPVK